MRVVLLALALVLAVPATQAPGVVAEVATEGDWGVAALNARLDGARHYALEIEGPPGSPFTVSYMQVHVSRNPQGGGTGNDDGTFSGTTPHEQDLIPPAPQVVFWRYSVVVTPDQPARLTVRILDRGPR